MHGNIYSILETFFETLSLHNGMHNVNPSSGQSSKKYFARHQKGLDLAHVFSFRVLHSGDLGEKSVGARSNRHDARNDTR